ncbi:MAG: GNAT family protein [Rikenellaceae bacterium]
MVNINGDSVVLRAVEPSDVDTLYAWENDVELWGISGTISPFSHFTLAGFIEAQRVDLFASRQMRLMICSSEEGCAVGALDMFEFDPLHRRAGVGIMVAKEFRKRGYAADALRAFELYVANYLSMRLLWCNVEEDNVASINLFTSLGYQQIGVKRDWNITADGCKSEIMFQKLIDS